MRRLPQLFPVLSGGNAEKLFESAVEVKLILITEALGDRGERIIACQKFSRRQFQFPFFDIGFGEHSGMAHKEPPHLGFTQIAEFRHIRKLPPALRL